MAAIHHHTSSSYSSSSSTLLLKANVDWPSHCPLATPLLGPSTPALFTFLNSIFEMPKEQYMCQLCANHGIFNQPKKGHKQKCPYRTCPCSLCALNTKRRHLDQIERQLKHTNEPMVAQAPVSMTTSPPQPECQLSPTMPKLTPNNPTSGRDTFRNSISNSTTFAIQLPATISKKEFKMLRRDDTTPLQNSLKRSYPKSIDDTMEPIKKEKPSIFHSAEMLAIGDSTQ
ncbi:unnamed protein product [Caenorhabditis nigoni]